MRNSFRIVGELQCAAGKGQTGQAPLPVSRDGTIDAVKLSAGGLEGEEERPVSLPIVRVQAVGIDQPQQMIQRANDVILAGDRGTPLADGEGIEVENVGHGGNRFLRRFLEPLPRGHAGTGKVPEIAVDGPDVGFLADSEGEDLV